MSRPFGTASLLVFFAALCGSVLPAAGSLLRPISFDDQVARADSVFLARVREIRADWRDVNGTRLIVTTVIFDPLKIYKGAPENPAQVEFLGGRVGDSEIRVEGIPQFTAGEECILFLRTTPGLCPLVGWERGRKLVRREEDGLATVEGMDAAPGQVPMVLSNGKAIRSSRSGGMKLEAFEALISRKLSAGGSR